MSLLERHIERKIAGLTLEDVMGQGFTPIEAGETQKKLAEDFFGKDAMEFLREKGISLYQGKNELEGITKNRSAEKPSKFLFLMQHKGRVVLMNCDMYASTDTDIETGEIVPRLYREMSVSFMFEEDFLELIRNPNLTGKRDEAYLATAPQEDYRASVEFLQDMRNFLANIDKGCHIFLPTSDTKRYAIYQRAFQNNENIKPIFDENA